MNAIVFILVAFFVLLLLNVPICVSIGLSCAAYTILYGGLK